MDRPTVDREFFRECTTVSPWKSPLLIAGIYAAIVGLAWLGSAGSGWWLAVPCVVVIAGLQHHLVTLIHEGAHLGIHPNRRVNELISDVTCAVPVFTLTRFYRIFHLTHHKYVGSPEHDPEVAVYHALGLHYARQSWPAAAWMMVRHCIGISYVRFTLAQGRFFQEQIARGRLKPIGPRDIALYALVWGGIGVPAVLFGFWPELLVFWVLPLPTLVFLFLVLHGQGEHTGATGPTEFERTWVHDFNPVTNFFLYPIKSGYHLEHHLFAKVPWYHMERFRGRLLEDPEYLRRSEPVTATGYFFGERSIWRAMILGHGEYRTDDLDGITEEIPIDQIVSAETREEVDDQLAVVRP